MRRAIYLPLDEALRDKLWELARQERRRPRDQAVVLLERALAEPAVASHDRERKP